VYPSIRGYNLIHERGALEYESPKNQLQAGECLMNMKAMDRREFLKMAAAGMAAAAIPGCGRQAPSRKPNVLFVFDDQLRADVCGVYGGGNIATLHIDRLAAQGATFTNSVSSCPLCTPYRGMLQTGRYPTHSGIIMNFVEANHIQNPHCLADVFGAAGYDTGFIGKWHLSSGWRREEGLYKPDQAAVQAYREKNPETEFVAPGPGRLGYSHWQAFNFHTAFNDYYWYEDEPKRLYSRRYETDTQIDQAIAYMERRRNSDGPFFLSIAPHPPHPPFAPEFIPEGYLEKVPELIRWSPNVPADNPRPVIEMRYYLAMAKNVDDNLGRLMAYLDASGLAENTIVVFTSDHGEMHGSHGRLNKMVPYAEAINIPLIIRWPRRIPPGSRIEALQTPMDHLPTLCGLAGLRIPREVDGADLSRVVLGKGRDGREEVLIGSYTSHWDFFQTGTRWPEWRGVRTKQYTYCRWLTGEEELYDNLEDPFQMRNLAPGGAEPAVLKRLRGRLGDFLEAAHDDFRPGTAYGAWYDDRRNLLRTGLGPWSG
jgi:arylsulfatase A-like enzyme